MDPLSEVLSLLKLQTYVSGGFGVEAGTGLEFPRHKGIKCYAVISNSCWVAVEGVPDAVRLKAGDCFILLVACRSAWRRIYWVRARGSFPNLRTERRVMHSTTKAREGLSCLADTSC